MTHLLFALKEFLPKTCISVAKVYHAVIIKGHIVKMPVYLSYKMGKTRYTDKPVMSIIGYKDYSEMELQFEPKNMLDLVFIHIVVTNMSLTVGVCC